MSQTLRNVLAVVAGIVVGAAVSMGLITLSPILIPLPAGADASNAESLAASIHLFEPKHYLMPFLAHALGTYFGALVAYLVAASHKAQLAWLIGFVCLAGGIAAAFMIPAPAWFIALDLVVAYLPMAWLAIVVGRCLVRGTGARTHAGT